MIIKGRLGRNRLTDLGNKLMAAGIARVGDGQVHTAVFKMDNQQGPAV